MRGRDVMLGVVFVQAVATLAVAALGTFVQTVFMLNCAVALQMLNRRYNR
jgi:hypothetical protein